MKNYNLRMTIQTPNDPEPEDDEPQTYDEAHTDGDGEGYQKD